MKKPGWMKIFSTREWVIGSAVVVVVVALGLAIPQIFRIVESDRRNASRNNLKRFTLAFWMYAGNGYEKTGGNPKELYPALSSEPGILQMDADRGMQVVQAFDAEVFVSPGHPRSRALLRQAKADPASAVTDESYWYLGYALPDEERGMAFVEWYREQAANGSIPSPSIIERGEVRIYRLRIEIDSLLFMDDVKSGKIEQPIGDSTKPPSIVPLMIERPGLFEGGGHVMYADGHVRFLDYPGEYPMTRDFIEALESLGGLRPASARR